jgi:hypothetical protein
MSLQAAKDDLSVRKALTSWTVALGEIDLQMAQLKPENDGLTALYQSQRWYLLSAADAVVDENPDVATAADHFCIAGAFDSLGIPDAAARHWDACYKKSMNAAPAVRVRILQAYGRFLFSRGQPAAGRDIFNESLKEFGKMPKTLSGDHDPAKRLAEFHAIWAVTEQQWAKEDGHVQTQLRAASDAAGGIGDAQLKGHVLEFIERRRRFIEKLGAEANAT